MDITEILRKIGDIAVGTPETALSLASGAIAYPAAKFGGALTSAMTGGRGDLAQYAEDYITDKMTYKPTSQSGQQAMNIAGSVLSIPYKPAEYVKEKYGYIPGYATEMAINLLMPRLAGRWSEMKAKGLGQTGLYGGDLSKTMQEAKAKGEYPPGSFSNLADKKVRMEIDDSGAKLKVKNNYQLSLDEVNKLKDENYKYEDMLRRLTDYAKQFNEDAITLKQLQEADAMYQFLQGKIKGNEAKIQELYNAPERTYKLGEVLEHPKLFEEYPELKDYEVEFGNQSGAEYAGQSIRMGSMADKSEIIHEIQHAIQEKEGFARGGSPDTPIPPEYRMKFIQDTFNKIRPSDAKNGVPISETWKTAKDFVDKDTKVGSRYDYYTKQAGEIEARDAAARMNLTPQERMRTGPYTSEDIPLLDWIVRKGSGGTAAMKELPQKVTPMKLDKTVKSDEGYSYHATNIERLFDIAKEGRLRTHKPWEFTDQDVWPDGSTSKRSYFSNNAGIVWQFAPEEGTPVVIRTKASSLKRESTGDMYSDKPISAKYLEYLGEDGLWHPVRQLKGE